MDEILGYEYDSLVYYDIDCFYLQIQLVSTSQVRYGNKLCTFSFTMVFSKYTHVYAFCSFILMYNNDLLIEINIYITGNIIFLILSLYCDICVVNTTSYYI